MLGSRSIQKGEKAVQEVQSSNIESLKSPVTPIQIDITSQESVNGAQEEISSQFGRLDVLINNAGIAVFQDVDKLTAYRDTFETNVLGSIRVTEAMEPLLRRSSRPYVIYVSSSQGSITLRNDPEHKFYSIDAEAYRTSKAALNMVASCQRFRYAVDGIKVVAFNPGWCLSNLTGEEGREWQVKAGARDPKEPANALVEVVLGKRDSDIEKNGLLHVDGGVLPW